MTIKTIKDVEELNKLIDLPTIQVTSEKMATDNASSMFVRESTKWGTTIIPKIYLKISLTYIEQNLDGYNAGVKGSDNGAQFKKDVFIYGIIDIKEQNSLLVCISTKDYDDENFDEAFPVLLQNIVSFEILKNYMNYAKR